MNILRWIRDQLTWFINSSHREGYKVGYRKGYAKGYKAAQEDMHTMLAFRLPQIELPENWNGPEIGPVELENEN